MSPCLGKLRPELGIDLNPVSPSPGTRMVLGLSPVVDGSGCSSAVGDLCIPTVAVYPVMEAVRAAHIEKMESEFC